MSVIPFPSSSRTRHPAFRAESVSRSAGLEPRFVDDAISYGVESMPERPETICRSVVRAHLFRLGFGECSPIHGPGSHLDPIIARKGDEVIGVVAVLTRSDGTADFTGSEVERAKRLASTFSAEGESASAAVMSVRFLDGSPLRVEITSAGSHSLRAIPVTPFD